MRRVMEFTVTKTSGAARLACIQGKSPTTHDITMATPNCTLYTRIGSVPHLTKDMVQQLQNLPAIVQYSLTHWAEHHENLTAYGKGIKKFTAMEGFLSYVCMQDTSAPVPSGYNDKFGTSVWGRGGKLKLDPELFMKVQEALRPDIYQALCDSDTDKEANRKRSRKAADRTAIFLEKTLEHHNKSEMLKETSVLGTLEGGHHLEERMLSAKETSAIPLAGYCIEGLHRFGSDSENMAMQDIQDLIEKPLTKLSDDRLRLLPGVWSPLNILKAVALGIDLFESVYPYIVTERGCASVFNFNINKAPGNLKIGCAMEGRESSMEKLESTNETGESCSNEREKQLEINLKDKRYAADFGPLLDGCQCFTCQKHSRAYINHLLNTSELLAGTLLIMHNFHHYFSFFRTIREALQQDQLDSLTELIQQQSSSS